MKFFTGPRGEMGLAFGRAQGVSKVWMAGLLRYNLVDRTLMCLEFCWHSNEDSGLSSEWVG